MELQTTIRGHPTLERLQNKRKAPTNAHRLLNIDLILSGIRLCGASAAASKHPSSDSYLKVLKLRKTSHDVEARINIRQLLCIVNNYLRYSLYQCKKP